MLDTDQINTFSRLIASEMPTIAKPLRLRAKHGSRKFVVLTFPDLVARAMVKHKVWIKKEAVRRLKAGAALRAQREKKARACSKQVRLKTDGKAFDRVQP